MVDCIIWIAASFPLHGVSSKKVFEDLLFVFNKIKEVHPFSAGKLPANIILRFNAEVKKIRPHQNKYAVWRSASRILKELNDTNSQIFLSKAFLKRVFENFEIYGNTLYVVRGKYRFRVTKINGQSVGNLYDKAFTLLPCDNIYDLRQNFAVSLSYKAFLKLYGISKLDFMEYEYVKGGKKKKAFSQFSRKQTVDIDDFIDFDLYPKDSIAVLTLRKLSCNDETKKILSNFFKAAQKMRAIIVNLQNCRQGSSAFIQEFLNYLSLPPYFKNYSILSKISSKREKDKIFTIPQLGNPSVWWPEYKTGYAHYNERAEHLFNLTPAKRFIEVSKKFWKTSDVKFTGSICVLTNNATRGAAVRLATLLQDNKMAKIIGEPCGSSPSHYGGRFVFELPNTKMVLVLTSKLYQRPDQSKVLQSTITPDILVPWFEADRFCYKMLRQEFS